MKRFNKVLCFMLVFVAVMVAFCSVSFAATVGQPLTSPEPGWQRIDDNYKFIIYGNGTWAYRAVNGANGGYQHASNSKNATISFKFTGTKLRVLCSAGPSNPQKLDIQIDGITYSYSHYSSSVINKVLLFEKTGLTYGIHTVKITNSDEGLYYGLDAIDIDSDGYMIDYYQPTDLIATPSNAKVDLNWDAVEGASGYNIYRSTVSGTGYTKIGSNTTSSAITYEDEPLTNGTTYYYIVTAIVNGVESGPSNEASATPTAPTDPEPSGNNAILEITMVTGEIKEYDVTAAELQSFLTWYDGRSNGAEKAYYMIPEKNNIKPFLSRKEYIAFDKISSFEVKEYTE